MIRAALVLMIDIYILLVFGLGMLLISHQLVLSTTFGVTIVAIFWILYGDEHDHTL